MSLSTIFHPFTWRIKYHTSSDGKYKYLQDMDAKLKWIYEKAKNDKNINFIKAHPLTWKDYELVHSKAYIKKIRRGTKSEIQKYSWITWSKSFVRAQLYAGGILYDAAKKALKEGAVAALMVEGHHAQRDHGSGFCTFHHMASVVKKLLSENVVSKISIVDLDYHLGDGTIELLSDKNVSIFDMYGGLHKPARLNTKNRGVVVLKKIIIGWGQYKETLEKELPMFLNNSKPDLVFYVAGGDIFQEDRYGGINGVGLNEIQYRDRFVFEAVRKRGVPIVFSIGGGYVRYTGNKERDEKKRMQLANLHINTLLEASGTL